MIRIVNVVGVETVGEYRLLIRFSDGSSGVHDFEPIVSATGPMIEPLKDVDAFKRVFVSMGALTWPNGFDLDSIRLHNEMRKASELQFPAQVHLQTSAVRDERKHLVEIRTLSAVNKGLPASSKAAKTAATSMLTHSKSKERSGAKGASAASKVLSDPKPSKAAKTAAGSALIRKKK